MGIKKVQFSIVILLYFVFVSCSVFQDRNKDLDILIDGDYRLEVNTKNLQLRFTDNKGNTIVPNDTVSGLFINGKPVVSTEVQSYATNEIVWTKADSDVWTSYSTPEADLAGEILNWMLSSWSLDSAYIWDLVAAVVATDPELCPEIQISLNINVDEGSDQGQTILTNESANTWVCLEPDAGQIRARVERILRE